MADDEQTTPTKLDILTENILEGIPTGYNLHGQEYEIEISDNTRRGYAGLVAKAFEAEREIRDKYLDLQMGYDGIQGEEGVLNWIKELSEKVDHPYKFHLGVTRLSHVTSALSPYVNAKQGEDINKLLTAAVKGDSKSLDRIQELLQILHIDTLAYKELELSVENLDKNTKEQYAAIIAGRQRQTNPTSNQDPRELVTQVSSIMSAMVRQAYQQYHQSPYDNTIYSVS